MIVVKLSKDKQRIIVTGDGHTYSIAANEMAMREDGRPSGVTWAEALAAGNVYAHDDNVHGASHGLHGKLFATGYGPVLV